jgi:hypothetical protein
LVVCHVAWTNLLPHGERGPKKGKAPGFIDRF